MKKVTFDADVDFNGQYRIGNMIVKVLNERGLVTLEFENVEETEQPNEERVETTGFLQTGHVRGRGVDDLCRDPYSVTTASTYSSTDDFSWFDEDYEPYCMDIELDSDDSEEDDVCENVEINNTETNTEDDEFVQLAEKISKYDKDGQITDLILNILKNGNDKVAATVAKMMTNLTETIKKLEKDFAN